MLLPRFKWNNETRAVPVIVTVDDPHQVPCARNAEQERKPYSHVRGPPRHLDEKTAEFRVQQGNEGKQKGQKGKKKKKEMWWKSWAACWRCRWLTFVQFYAEVANDLSTRDIAGAGRDWMRSPEPSHFRCLWFTHTLWPPLHCAQKAGGCLAVREKSAGVHTQLCPARHPSGLQPARLLWPRHFPGKNTGAACHFLLQGFFLLQGSNPGLPCLPALQADSSAAEPSGKSQEKAQSTWFHVEVQGTVYTGAPLGLPWRSGGKESAFGCRGRAGFDPWLGG